MTDTFDDKRLERVLGRGDGVVRCLRFAALTVGLVLAGCAARPGPEVLNPVPTALPGAKMVTVYVATTAERDRFAGFSSRFTESVGVGYRVLTRPRLRLDVQAGPALRQTNYYDRDDEMAFSAKLAGDLSWTIRPDLVFTQNASLFLDSVSSSLTSTTALTTKLRGDLSARASFDVRVEAEPPAGREHTDTTTRATVPPAGDRSGYQSGPSRLPPSAKAQSAATASISC